MAKPAKKKKSLGRSSFSGFISLGMLTIPVKGYRAVTSKESEKVALNMICPDCHDKLKQEYKCPTHGTVDRSKSLKGFEGSPEKWTLIEEEFLDSICPDVDKSINITKFFSLELLDGMILGVPYFVVPEPEGKTAYELLLAALEETEMFGFGKYVMTRKEQVVALVPQEGGIVLWTLNRIGLIKDSTPFFEDITTEVESQMMGVMKKIIASKTYKEFSAEDFTDEYEELLLEGIQARVAGKALKAPKASAKKSDPNDLLAALMGSVD
jgi:DNA end-binding protein Ku